MYFLNFYSRIKYKKIIFNVNKKSNNNKVKN